MPRGKNKEAEEKKQLIMSQAVSKFFGGITKQEAYEVFRTLAVLAQFPGATPPEPLSGCEVWWTGCIPILQKYQDAIANR